MKRFGKKKKGVVRRTGSAFRLWVLTGGRVFFFIYIYMLQTEKTERAALSGGELEKPD